MSPKTQTANTDAYTWNGGQQGDWGTAANWTDAATGTTAATAPGATNAVSVDGFGFTTITGTGASASLTLDGFVTLGGQFSTGGLDIGTYDIASLGAGDTLADFGNATLQGGASLYLSGAGAALSVAGTLVAGQGVSSSIHVGGGASVNLAALSGTEPLSISLDAASSFEVGGGHAATAGSFTIDQGNTTSLSGSLSLPTLALGGVLDAQSLTITAGTLSGAGTIAILGSLDLAGYQGITGGAGLSLDFAGPGAVLRLDATSLDSAGRLEPVITGFAAGDLIDWSGPLTGATFGKGTLTLHNGTQTVASLDIAGKFASQRFVVAPTSYPDNTSEIVLVGAGDTKLAPKGTSAANTYVWNNVASGSWDSAANWTDTTTGANPAALAPGAKDSVTVNALYDGASTETVVMSGIGNAATLNVAGTTAFAGTFTAAALNETSVFGEMAIVAGARLSVTGVAQINALAGTIAVTGANAVLAVGTLDLGSAQFTSGDASIALAAGGVLTAVTVQDYAGGIISIDAASAFAVGAAGTAAAGSMTIDSGATAAIGAEIVAPSLVVDGTLIAGLLGGDDAAPLLLDVAAISGSGTIEVQTSLAFAQAATWARGPVIDVLPGGTLALSAAALDGNGHFGGTIGSFVPGDTIDWQAQQPLTGTAFANGTLSLLTATGTVATVAVQGIAANETFLLLPSAYANSAVVVTGLGDTKVAPAGTGSADSYTWRGATNASWDQAGNWNDTSAGASPASVAPGSNDAVTLGANPSNGVPSVVSGKGNAGALTIDGSYLFAGMATRRS